MSLNILLKCPHCQEIVEIVEIACAIFRHGVLKSNLEQINPHSSKEECNKLIEDDLIYGCGKPFKIIQITNSENVISYELVVCEYI